MTNAYDFVISALDDLTESGDGGSITKSEMVSRLMGMQTMIGGMRARNDSIVELLDSKDPMEQVE